MPLLNTVSYLSGPKANLLANGLAKLCVEFAGKKKPLQSQNSSSTSSAQDDTNWLTATDKPKLVVINSENSKFSNNVIDVSDSQSNSQRENGALKKVSSKLKRKKTVLEESDSDDLNFGEKFASQPAIKKRSSDILKSSQTSEIVQSQSQNGIKGDSGSDSDPDFTIIDKSETSKKKSKAIVIDSDSE